jgi:hypothetical protein
MAIEGALRNRALTLSFANRCCQILDPLGIPSPLIHSWGYRHSRQVLRPTAGDLPERTGTRRTACRPRRSDHRRLGRLAGESRRNPEVGIMGTVEGFRPIRSAPPPHTKTTRTMSHPEIGFRNDAIHAAVATAQQVLVELAQSIWHGPYPFNAIGHRCRSDTNNPTTTGICCPGARLTRSEHRGRPSVRDWVMPPPLDDTLDGEAYNEFIGSGSAGLRYGAGRAARLAGRYLRHDPCVNTAKAWWGSSLSAHWLGLPRSAYYRHWAAKLRDAHISAMKSNACSMAASVSPSSWPGLSGPSVAARAGIGGPDKPGHDEVAMAAADRFQDLCMR